MLQQAKAAIDQMFFVGLQEEMVVSGLLLLRMMDGDAGAARGLDSAELRARASTLPRERSTRHQYTENNITTAVVLDGKVLVNHYSEVLHTRLMTDSAVGETISSLNSFDSQLYDYGKSATSFSLHSQASIPLN